MVEELTSLNEQLVNEKGEVVDPEGLELKLSQFKTFLDGHRHYPLFLHRSQAYVDSAREEIIEFARNLGIDYVLIRPLIGIVEARDNRTNSFNACFVIAYYYSKNKN